MWRIATALAAAVIVVGALSLAPSIAAGGLLYPERRTVAAAIPAACSNKDFEGDGVILRGWHCTATGKRRGTVVYLHGIADNRGSSAGAVDRFTRKGFDVVAYDSRRHGDSGGDVCTYGFLEKRDLRRVVDGLPPGPVVLMGTSLGAAVALQEAAADPRITSVIAAEAFSDLRTVATERAPWFLPPAVIRKAFAGRRTARRVPRRRGQSDGSGTRDPCAGAADSRRRTIARRRQRIRSASSRR